MSKYLYISCLYTLYMYWSIYVHVHTYVFKTWWTSPTRRVELNLQNTLFVHAQWIWEASRKHFWLTQNHFVCLHCKYTTYPWRSWILHQNDVYIYAYMYIYIICIYIFIDYMYIYIYIYYRYIYILYVYILYVYIYKMYIYIICIDQCVYIMYK